MTSEKWHPVISELKSYGVSMKEIAAAANVHPRHLRAVKSGQRQSRRVENIARALLAKLRH